jgi:HSP20 family protein
MKLIRHNTPWSSLAENWFELPLEKLNRFLEWGDSLQTLGIRGANGSSDLYEDEHNFFVRFELPGVNKDNLSLNLQEGLLVLSHEKKDESSVRSFKSSVSVPRGADVAKATAKLDKGVLTITLPKHESSKPKPITIE